MANGQNPPGGGNPPGNNNPPANNVHPLRQQAVDAAQRLADRNRQLEEENQRVVRERDAAQAAAQQHQQNLGQHVQEEVTTLQRILTIIGAVAIAIVAGWVLMIGSSNCIINVPGSACWQSAGRAPAPPAVAVAPPVDLGPVNRQIADLGNRVTTVEQVGYKVTKVEGDVASLKTTVDGHTRAVQANTAAIAERPKTDEIVTVVNEKLQPRDKRLEVLETSFGWLNAEHKSALEDFVKKAKADPTPPATTPPATDARASARNGEVDPPTPRDGEPSVAEPRSEATDDEPDSKHQVADNRHYGGRKRYLTPSQLESLSPDIPLGGDSRCVNGVQGYWVNATGPNGRPARVHRKCFYN